MWFSSKKEIDSEEYRKVLLRVQELDSKLLNLENSLKVLAKEFESEFEIVKTNMNSLRGLVNRKIMPEEKTNNKNEKVYLGE